MNLNSNPTFTVCPPMEPSYSTSSEASTFSSDMYSPVGIDIPIPRSQASFDPFDDFSPPNDFSSPNSYTLQTPPDLYSFNMPFPIPAVPSSSPFDTTAQWPVTWDDFTIPDYLGTNESLLEPSKPASTVSPTSTSTSPSTRPFGCISCGKAFTRAADLKRHESSVHFPIKQDCPVGDCLRKDDNGFPRRDHLIEHLRSYHHIDVPKRRASKRVSKSA